MRRFSARLLTLILLCVVLRAPRAAAQEGTENAVGGDSTKATEGTEEEPRIPEPSALAYNAAILDEVLQLSTKQTIREKKFAAAAGITGGAILVGLGSWRLIEETPQSQYSRGLGVMFMTLGMADLTTGIFAAVRIPHEKRRLERWERARKDGITDAELAHFEGELQASHELRQGERLLVRWDAFTHALAGIIVLVVTPIPGTSSAVDRVSGYVIGAVFTAVGFATFGASFRETPSEKAWGNYNRRKIPMPGHELSWGVAPAISRQGAGLSIGGTF
ncbi:MAG: hypothetical protein WCE62_06050 [Polyangiales bacterium]